MGEYCTAVVYRKHPFESDVQMDVQSYCYREAVESDPPRCEYHRRKELPLNDHD